MHDPPRKMGYFRRKNTAFRLQVLGQLALFGELTGREIGVRCGKRYDFSGIYAVCFHLQELGALSLRLEPRPAPQAGNRYLYSITQAGRELAAKYAEQMDA